MSSCAVCAGCLHSVSWVWTLDSAVRRGVGSGGCGSDFGVSRGTRVSECTVSLVGGRWTVLAEAGLHLEATVSAPWWILEVSRVSVVVCPRGCLLLTAAGVRRVHRWWPGSTCAPPSQPMALGLVWVPALIPHPLDPRGPPPCPHQDHLHLSPSHSAPLFPPLPQSPVVTSRESKAPFVSSSRPARCVLLGGRGLSMGRPSPDQRGLEPGGWDPLGTLFTWTPEQCTTHQGTGQTLRCPPSLRWCLVTRSCVAQG